MGGKPTNRQRWQQFKENISRKKKVFPHRYFKRRKKR